MGASVLQYEPTVRARPVVVERDGGVTRIVVPTPGPSVPVPGWVLQLDLLALVVVPVWWVASFLVGTALPRPKPPRAVFEVSEDRFKMTLREPGSGVTNTFEWPRAAVAEVRANRYDPGLWIDVPGHVKETYLADLPRGTIERLERALNAALAGRNASVAAAAPVN